MNALMPSFKMDMVKAKRVNMAALANILKNADEIDGLTPVDHKSQEHLQHYFANGAYVREMIMPANTAIVGRIHKHETINILLEGEIIVIDETGTKKHLKAPHVFVAQAGNQKAAMTVTSVRWLNSFACDTTDPEEAIDLLTCETIEEYQAFLDTNDVNLLTSELGHDSESMLALMNSEPVDESKLKGVSLRSSDIDGVGVFADSGFSTEENIGPMRLNGLRSILGRYTNHSTNPNSKPEFINNELQLTAVRAISCGEEVTCNYREVLKAKELEGENL